MLDEEDSRKYKMVQHGIIVYLNGQNIQECTGYVPQAVLPESMKKQRNY
jgi:hypothetical protein